MLIRRRSILTDVPLNFPPPSNSTGVPGNKRKKLDEVIDELPNSKRARRQPTLLDALFDLPIELSHEVPNPTLIDYEISIT